MSLKNNEYVTVIKVVMTNKGPLKIGNGDEGILIDLASNSPYLPGTSLAGAIRAYLSKEYDVEIVKALFGHGDRESNINISDSYAFNKKEIEYRPGISINNRLGVNESGGYFTRELLGLGHEFTVEIKLYSNNLEKRDENISLIKSALSAIHVGKLRLGGYKSNGAGIFEVNTIDVCYLDLKNTRDLLAYLSDSLELINAKNEFLNYDNNFNNSSAKFTIECTTKTPLLIKGNDTLNYNLPDGSNMVNSNGEYILPGSSFKGAIRNAFGKIAKYKGIEELIVEAFGDEKSNKEKKNEEKQSGRMYFEDIKIQNHLDKAIYNRIKIDRFTGGVRSGAILNDNPIKGKFTTDILFNITGKEEIDNKIIALMLFTLRDALKGEITFGSGNSIGRGKLNGAYIKLEYKGEILKLDLTGKNHENAEKIQELISSIN